MSSHRVNDVHKLYTTATGQDAPKNNEQRQRTAATIVTKTTKSGIAKDFLFLLLFCPLAVFFIPSFLLFFFLSFFSSHRTH
jgi:hypothetical protein